ncbi:translation initiation factor IF-3 [Cellulosimicrobium marinum]|uniref:translation initiation factor IF-3 n=1 Tax=Cellulosimicrobium marinum TaxID=1638992 RepID=UPI001E2E636D|nr:translation initiation factor IF-3 [Cellulosimicrobium marinum]
MGPGGEQVGVVRTEVALSLAQDADLDLVEVAPDARPPVAKLMDFGKFKYESDMKAREARRNQANTVLKEIRFRLKIDPHDYGTKKGHVERFLAAGDKVKVMIMFRGREQSRPEMGVRLLQRLADDVAELGFVESMPKQDGRNMTMVLGPVKKKADAKSEQRKRAQEAEPRLTKSAQRAAARATDAPEPSAEQPEQPAAEPQAVEQPQAVEAPVAEQPAPAVEQPAEAPRPRAAATSAPRAAAPRPATAKPATAKPATAKPAAAKPAAAKPAGSTPRPAAAKPAAPAPRPAAPKPGAPRPAPKPAPRGKAG